MVACRCFCATIHCGRHRLGIPANLARRMTFQPPLRKRKKIKDGRLRSPQHRRWIAVLPCSIAGCTEPSECAHVRMGTDGAMGRKPSDSWCVPACRTHHAEQHTYGEATFWDHYQIDALALAERLARMSPDARVRKMAGVRYGRVAED